MVKSVAILITFLGLSFCSFSESVRCAYAKAKCSSWCEELTRGCVQGYEMRYRLRGDINLPEKLQECSDFYEKCISDCFREAERVCNN